MIELSSGIMRVTAAIFLFLLSFLIIQPAISSKPAGKRMMGERMCAMMKNCKKNKESEKKDCNTCNPFMACSFGNFFITGNASMIFLVTESTAKCKAINDNRVSDNLSDCWHPPESAYL